jgi:hypothetical protein
MNAGKSSQLTTGKPAFQFGGVLINSRTICGTAAASALQLTLTIAFVHFSHLVQANSTPSTSRVWQAKLQIAKLLVQ